VKAGRHYPEEPRRQTDTCAPLLAAVRHGDVKLEAIVRGHYPGSHRLPPGMMPGVRTIGFWDACKDQDWMLGWHRNEGVEITFLEQGNLGFSAEDREYRLQSGDLTITRPWQVHRIGLPRVQASRLHWVILDVGVRRPHQEWKWPPWLLLSRKDLDELTRVIRQNNQVVWRGTTELRRCFRKIAEAVGEEQYSHLAVRVNEMFLLLLEMLQSENVELDETLSCSLRTVQLFLEDLRRHPKHLELPWSAREMAACCGLGLTQFDHHVKVVTGLTPMKYLSQCRLERALTLLREIPKRNVTDIAIECGFSSSQYFATAFRKQYGASPMQAVGLRAEKGRAGRQVGPPASASALPRT